MNEPMRFYDRTLSRMTRRELLNVAWKLGLAAVLQPLASARAFAQPIFRSYPFALGVASGEPSPDGVVLWTRLAPEPLAGGGMPMANVEVGWEIAQDRAFTMLATKGVAVARPELGHSVRVEPNLVGWRNRMVRLGWHPPLSPLSVRELLGRLRRRCDTRWSAGIARACREALTGSAHTRRRA